MLVRVVAPDGASKHIVRGYASCKFHQDVYEKTAPALEAAGVASAVLGGGRIQREAGRFLVYGYSVGYGQADHTISVAVLRKAYPQDEIEWNNEGY